MSISDEIRLRRERSDGITKNVVLEKNRKSYAISLHYHFSFLNDFVSSLFGCEEWLRFQLRKMIAREAMSEIFAAWYVRTYSTSYFITFINEIGLLHIFSSYENVMLL